MRPIRNIQSLTAAPFVAVLLLFGVVPAIVIPMKQAVLMRQDAAASVIVLLALACILVRWMASGTHRFFASPLYLPLAGFLILVALSITACRPPCVPLGIEDAYRWLLLATLFLVTLNFARSDTRPLWVVAVWALSAIAVVVKEFALQSVIDIPKFLVQSRIGRSMGNVNLFGGYMAAICVLCMPLMLHFLKKEQRRHAILSSILFLLAASGVWFSGSRGAAVGAWAGGAYVLLACTPGTFRKKLIILTCAVLLVGAIGTAIPFPRNLVLRTLESGTTGWRLYVYAAALRMTQARPLLGFGPGSFIAEYPFFRNPDVFTHYYGQAPVSIHAHNHLLEVAAENGIPALLLLAVFYAMALMPNLLAGDGSPRLNDLAATVRIAAGGACAALLAHGFFSVLLDTNLAPASHLWMGLAIACTPPRRQRPLPFGSLASLALCGILLVSAAGTVLALNAARSALSILRAATYEDRSAWHTALFYYDRALRLRPWNHFAIRAKALCQRHLHDYEGALATYAHLSTLAPRFGYNDFEIAELHFKMNDEAKALASLQKWMKINPHHAPAHAMLINLKLDAGDIDQASRLSDSAVDRWPTEPAVLAAAGRVQAAAGRYQKALILFTAASRVVPTDARLKSNIAMILTRTGDKDRGREYLHEIIRSEIDPTDPALRKAYLTLHPNAEKQFATLVKEGLSHAKAGEFESAIEKFRIALILDDDNAAVLHDLGRAHYLQAEATLKDPARRRRLFRKAADLFRRACQLDPTNLSVRKQLGDSLFRAGDPAGSLHVSTEIKRLAPDDPDVDQIILTLRRDLGIE